MSQSVQTHIPFNVVVRGKIVSMPDIWGNRFPVPESTVELFSSFGSMAVLGASRTGPEAMFTVVSANHSPIIPDKELFLEFRNNATQETYRPKTTFGFMKPVLRGIDKHFDLKAIETPWPGEPPVIARFRGRQFKYPVDLTRGLIGAIGSSGSLELVWSTTAPWNQLDENDRLFAILEKESKGPDSGIVAKLANEIIPALGLDRIRIRDPRDAFRQVLDRFSDFRFNTYHFAAFKGHVLAAAVQRVFGGPFPSFFGFEGRVSFCGLAFAALAVAAGSNISTSVATVGTDHVTTVVIS